VNRVHKFKVTLHKYKLVNVSSPQIWNNFLFKLTCEFVEQMHAICVLLAGDLEKALGKPHK